MDSIFQIGFPELLAILVLAGLIMGPQRIRQVALYLGRLSARMRSVSRQFTRQLNAELDAAERGEIKAAIADFKALQQEVTALRREIADVPRLLRQEGETALQSGPDKLRRQLTESPPPTAANMAAPPDYLSNRILPPEKDLAFSPNDLARRKPEALPQPIQVPEDPEA